MNFFSHKKKKEAEEEKKGGSLILLKKNKWSTFCLPTKFLTNLEVAAANSSRHFSRQLQPDRRCLPYINQSGDSIWPTWF